MIKFEQQNKVKFIFENLQNGLVRIEKSHFYGDTTPNYM